jgi:hypothetical protein
MANFERCHPYDALLDDTALEKKLLLLIMVVAICSRCIICSFILLATKRRRPKNKTGDALNAAGGNQTPP